MNSILVVDDSVIDLRRVSSVLRGRFETRIAKNGSDAMRLLDDGYRPDLILLDIEMPEISGYQVCHHVKNDPATFHIPIVFLTSRTSEKDEELGFLIGATDYLVKPIGANVLLARVQNLIDREATQRELSFRNARLKVEVEQHATSLIIANETIIDAMVLLAEFRDNETGAHIQRTSHYVQVLGEALAKTPKYRDALSTTDIATFAKCAPLHDIGKIGIPDSILMKPGRLTEEERLIMNKHTVFGREALDRAMQGRGGGNEYLRVARDIAGGHHERWDGTGYPDGLAGNQIPLCARLMAVADVYDALISPRVYKPAMPHSEAVNFISAGSGTLFDPDIVAAFFDCSSVFNDIRNRYRGDLPISE